MQSYKLYAFVFLLCVQSLMLRVNGCVIGPPQKRATDPYCVGQACGWFGWCPHGCHCKGRSPFCSGYCHH
uniref:Putative secreted protein n=1 Tax=Amblyomma triste TaxID=251400 RepID=A0A023G946_AMBTT